MKFQNKDDLDACCVLKTMYQHKYDNLHMDF